MAGTISQIIEAASLLMILGLVGEYIGIVGARILNRPLVFEKERIDFPAESEKQTNKTTE
ncbi:MAG: hypothetical protein IIB71_04615 [Proteobacteria bacterium]|nr:hypothetical protein [Pseudomonadota bacterium]